MSRAIRFTKAEMEAVGQVAAGDTTVDQLSASSRKALGTLLAKMQGASDPAPQSAMRVTPRDFAKTLQDAMGDMVVVSDHATTWIRLHACLKSEPFENLDAVRELGESVLTWARSPMSVLTLATKGPEWLAVHRARKVAAPRGTPPRRMMWDEDE